MLHRHDNSCVYIRCALTNLFKYEPCLCLCCEFCNLISVYSHQQSANLKTPGWCNQNHTHREFASFRWNERPSNYPGMSVINLIKHVYLTHVCLQASYHTELADWMCALRFRHKGEVGPMQETEPERDSALRWEITMLISDITVRFWCITHSHRPTAVTDTQSPDS